MTLKVFSVLLLLVILAPASVFASQTTRTLQPNRTYTFTGTDARLISHVNVPAGSRFEITETNAQGEMLNFGFSSRRFSVIGTGSTAVTPTAAMTVSFDASRISFSSADGSVLRQISLGEGQSVRLQNTGLTALNIRTNQAAPYEYVIFDRLGDADRFSFDFRFPVLSVAGGASAVVTASGGDLRLYFPSAWDGGTLRVSRQEQPALARHTLTAGQTLLIANNNSSGSLTLLADVPDSDLTFQYDYITRGRDGHVEQHGTVTSARLVLGAGQSTQITPLIGGVLYFPYAWLGNLDIFADESAPIYHYLQTGESVTFENADPVREHRVFVRCYDDSGFFSFEYILRHGGEFSFDVLDNMRELALPPRSVLTLTAWDGALALGIPDIPSVTALPGGETLTRREVAYGEYLHILNPDRRYLHPFLVHGYDYDFIMTDSRENILDYGIGTPGHHTVLAASSVTLTPRGGETLFAAFPEGAFRVSSADDAPLHHITLTPGRFIILENRTRQNFAIANNSRDGEAGFFLRGAGETVRVYRDVVLNPGEMVSPGNFFPPEWSLILPLDLLPPVPAPPRIGQEARYEYIPNRRVRLSDPPEHGNIYLSAGSRLTITAAMGADLEIWLPKAWAALLGLI